MTRDRIFQAAKALFARDGVSGVSMRDVAKAAGVTPMAIYRHFTDKEALIDALMADGFAAWEAKVRTIRVKDPLLWLERLFDAFLDFALSDPHRFDAAFIFPSKTARRYPDDFVAGRSPVIAMAYARIDQAKQENKLGDCPTPEIAVTLSALAQGFVSMQRANRFMSEHQLRIIYRAAMRRSMLSFGQEFFGKEKV